MVTMIITTKGADISLKNIMKDLNNMVDSTLEDKFDVRKEVSPLITYMDVKMIAKIHFILNKLKDSRDFGLPIRTLH